jgi:hypothetical protein
MIINKLNVQIILADHHFVICNAYGIDFKFVKLLYIVNENKIITSTNIIPTIENILNKHSRYNTNSMFK